MTGRFERASITEEWFMARVSPEPMTGCWLWTADFTSLHGYGLVSITTDEGRRREAASRTSWRIFRGEIPVSLLVLHRCDNPPCVNPDHLFLGTQSDNLKDAYRKGRARSPWSRRVTS